MMAEVESFIENLIQKVQLPYQVTQLSKEELGILEKKFYEISGENQATVVKIAEEIFDSEMPLIVKDGRWFYCLIYGVIEFLQENYKQQSEQTSGG
ncbi:MAG: hypothetical protein ACPLXC_01590 [Candidatus Pacearchaeota archaeon]